MSKSGNLYFRLYEAYKKPHPAKSKQILQFKANDLWSTLKKSENVANAVKEEKKLNCLLTSKKAKLLNCFSGISSTNKGGTSSFSPSTHQEKSTNSNVFEVSNDPTINHFFNQFCEFFLLT